MKNPLYLLILAGLFIAPLALGGEGDIPKKVVFKASLGPVTFLHDKHIEFINHNCILCHHVKGEKEKQSCRTCHKKKTETKEGDPLSFYDVKMEFCRGCHNKEKEKNSASKAATACSDCHNIKEAMEKKNKAQLRSKHFTLPPTGKR